MTCWVKPVNGFPNAGGCSALGAVHRKKCLHHGDCDLVRLKGHDGAIAANDLVTAQMRLLRTILRPGRERQQRGCSGWYSSTK